MEPTVINVEHMEK